MVMVYAAWSVVMIFGPMVNASVVRPGVRLRNAVCPPIVLGPIDVFAGSILHLGKVVVFPRTEGTIRPDPFLGPLDTSLFTLQTNELPAGDRSAAHALSYPLVLVDLAMRNPTASRSDAG